jgi:hypothetical protein
MVDRDHACCSGDRAVNHVSDLVAAPLLRRSSPPMGTPLTTRSKNRASINSPRRCRRTDPWCRVASSRSAACPHSNRLSSMSVESRSRRGRGVVTSHLDSVFPGFPGSTRLAPGVWRCPPKISPLAFSAQNDPRNNHRKVSRFLSASKPQGYETVLRTTKREQRTSSCRRPPWCFTGLHLSPVNMRA